MLNREEILYLAPYLFSLLLSLGIFIYTWRRPQVRGARTYSWFAAGQTLTILGFIFELVSPHLQTKIFWDRFQWLADTFLVILPFLVFSVQFSEHKLRYPKLSLGILAAFLLVFTALFLTDGIHHLFYPNPTLSAETPFPELKYDFTFVIYSYALVYVYGANLYGIGLLVRRAFQPHNLVRSQYLIIASGFSVTLILSILALADIRLAPQRDLAPFSLAIGNLIVVWGLFRYGLFDIAPIARQQIIQDMLDPVIVLDPRNRVVDINRAALALADRPGAQVIGLPFQEVFAGWPVILELLDGPAEQKKSISITRKDEAFYFDITTSPILGQQRELLGRIVAARDITRHKQLEMNYRDLSAELEQRVQERTEELHKSAERYRAVVENQTEYIVRWGVDGIRTFVNEAYCRYFGLTFEQALSEDFLPLIVEEDRRAVEEKISRLKAGVTNVETDVHRVIRPDGSIGWQEWTDQAIRDEAGKVVEFQSVGCDITERKQAQDALQKSEERFSKAFQASPIIVIISQLKHGKLLEVNDTFEKITGFTRAEAIGKTTIELGLWVDPAERDRILATLGASGKLRNEELQFRTRNGDVITCLVSTELIELEGEKCALAILEDISERKKAEARILRLNRLYVTISQINQTLVRAPDKHSLFSEICRVATDHGQFRMAWIGLIDETDHRLKPTVFAGEESGYLANIKINYRNEIVSIGPAGTAAREGRCVICQDISSDPRTDVWREPALERGYRSTAAVPIRQQGRVIGALTVYAGEPHAFDAEDEELLEQIGLDVSFALDSLEAEAKRKHAEEKLAEAYDTTLEGWAKALELRDKETEGHSRRVMETTLIMCQAMGFSEEELVDIRRGSILHDIGKMGIPDEILRKNGPLNEAERQIVMKHPGTAYDLLKRIPYLEKALEIPYCHHEKWDGTGYPRGLKGEEIPLPARIFAVVDVWDALSSDRPYRKPWTPDEVKAYLLGEAGKYFDPQVVNVFVGLVM